jgi:DNA-binding XRE family transcriptional regulator
LESLFTIRNSPSLLIIFPAYYKHKKTQKTTFIIKCVFLGLTNHFNGANIIKKVHKKTQRSAGEVNEMLISVKAARVNAGMSQQEVAEQLNLSLTGYKKKENGITKFYVDEMVMISKLFGVKIEYFFEAQCRKKTQKECAN